MKTNGRLAVNVCAVLLAGALVPTVSTSHAQPSQVVTTSNATDLARAIVQNPTQITAASFDAIPPLGTPHGISAALGGFPTSGPDFAILTNGNASLASRPNTGPLDSADLAGAPIRGPNVDVSILRIELNVPAAANCLSIDFRFLSEEFPEFVGSIFNDGFIAELDNSTWTTQSNCSGGPNDGTACSSDSECPGGECQSAITAPDNFAFDPARNVISINAAGVTSMTVPEAVGTTYDGATPLLTASTPITPGAHTLYLSIFDAGDRVADSAVFLDRLVLGATVAGACQSGATVLATAKTADNPVASVGGSNGYTIVVTNPGSQAVTLAAITDSLPPGFSYLTGSTSGATTADPNVVGQNLTWTGPFPLPALGNATLHFAVRVANVAGEYFNNAGAMAAGVAVTPTGPTAPISIAGGSICGDADQSGSITITDGVLAFRTATDLLGPCRPETCDMTGTGLPITVTDGVNVLLLAAGLPGLSQCPRPLGSVVRSAGHATATDATTSSTATAVTAPPVSAAALAKLADKCQRELGRQGVRALQQQLGPLDRCIRGVLKCVATAADLPACLVKARPLCVEKASTKVTKGQERAIRKIVDRCAALDLGELRDATGLGYADVSTDCLERQNVDLCDAEEVARCLVAEADRNAAQLYGMQAPRAHELYRLVRPQDAQAPPGGQVPPDPFAELPDFTAAQSGPGPFSTSGKDILKCGTAITRAGDAFATRGLATLQKCLTGLFTCVRAKPGDPGCLPKAEAKCTKDLQKLTQSTKLEDTIRKGCGVLPFEALLRGDGLNIEALAPICAELGVPALNGLDDYLGCVRQSQQCRLLDLVRFAVPRGDALDPGDALEIALRSDRCPLPAVGGTLTSAPSPRAGPVLAGIRRFINTISRGGFSGNYRRGVAPSSTTNLRRRVNSVSARRFAPRGSSNRLFVRYTRGIALTPAASKAIAEPPPQLFIRVERADNSVVPDYFDIDLPADPPAGQFSSDCPNLDECEVAVDLEFPDDLRGCAFNVLVAAAENGDVSDYQGLEQVPAAPISLEKRAEIVFTITGKPDVQAFRVGVGYPLEKGTFVGEKDQVACASTAGGASVFVANDREDGTLLLAAGHIPALAFPIEVRCAFDTVTREKLKSKDFTVVVDEVSAGGVPADPAALEVKATLQVTAVP